MTNGSRSVSPSAFCDPTIPVGQLYEKPKGRFAVAGVSERGLVMRVTYIAAIAAMTVLASCGDGVSDPAGRPKDAADYNAQVDRFAAAKASGEATAEDFPMLTREQKERAVLDMGEEPDDTDINGKPGTAPEKVRALKESFVAYYTAPFGTVEEREAWRRYMRAIEDAG